MKNLPPFLQIELNFSEYKIALLCFITAFAVAMVSFPPLIRILNRYQLHDKPGLRKEHSIPTPTLGGIAIIAGMLVSVTLWFPFSFSTEIVTSLIAMTLLFAMGITDDLKDLSAKYKFIVEVALASLIALAGLRITTFGGLFGFGEIPVPAQYTITIVAIVGITNAFNLIDGIDGLAGGLGFMSLTTLGIFLTMSGDKSFGLIAFALAGGMLAFLYFNMNPAQIFMGDTGSLVLGFVVAILCTRLIQLNNIAVEPLFRNTPLFALAIVLIPVYDTVRVFTLRMWKGQSPFNADKTHIHHLLTNAGLGHGLSSTIICLVHGFILMEVYWLNELRPELILSILVGTMTMLIIALHQFRRVQSRRTADTGQTAF